MGFRSFVILAAMRTGSNFLEESLNGVPGITCHGELFNPAFVGYPKGDAPFGVTREDRDLDPLAVVARLNNAPGLNGFRFFPDHDPRVLGPVLADDTCAKIILNRNPADSYVSLAIARRTDQWKLGDIRSRKTARVRFDEAEFLRHLNRLAEFRRGVQMALQQSGQTAFHLDYDDLGDVAVLRGLLRFLGAPHDVARPTHRLLPQNPEPLAEKVTNPREMAAALARLDPFGLSRIPEFEPRRGPAVPSFVTARGAPLLFMPVRSGPVERTEQWLAKMGTLTRGHTQSSLKDWMRQTGAHRRFTVLRHPVLRAFAAYERLVLGDADPDQRDQVARFCKITPAADANSQRTGFEAFLRFLKANLNGQTPVRTDPSWASQTAVLQGFQGLFPPDLVAREDTLETDLIGLCGGLGLPCPPLPAPDKGLADRLLAIHDSRTEALARQAYGRDYLTFGFDDWAG